MLGLASYRNRLAWAVVFRILLTASCPAAAVTTPPTTPTPAPGQPTRLTTTTDTGIKAATPRT